MCKLEGFIFQPKGPASDFVVFIFRVTRLDIFAGKHSEPLHRGSDTNCPRETYGECTGLWPALLFNTPAGTLSQELKAQLQKCQVMTFSFPFENYPTVIWILTVRKLFFPFFSSVFMLQIEGMQNCMFCNCVWSLFLVIMDTNKHMKVLFAGELFSTDLSALCQW